jgi:4-hydroxy 2-oxovalerate aldolase
LKSKINIVDVSLRDGGYLNNWNFTSEQIFNVISLLDSLKIDIVELGYMTNDTVCNMEQSVMHSLLDRVSEKNYQIKLALMINPKFNKCLELLKQFRGHIDIIRIPFNLNTVDTAVELAGKISELGFSVSLNFISVSAYQNDELLNIIYLISFYEYIDILYIADSRGALYPANLAKIIFAIRKIWKKEIGFHGHDNLGLSLENSLTAVEAGCTLIDVSINGYGLGGGNTKLTSVIRALGREGIPEDNLMKKNELIAYYLDLVRDESFRNLYYLSGLKNLEQEWVLMIINRFKNAAIDFLNNF